jgi:hypothetical protein
MSLHGLDRCSLCRNTLKQQANDGNNARACTQLSMRLCPLSTDKCNPKHKQLFAVQTTIVIMLYAQPEGTRLS